MAGVSTTPVPGSYEGPLRVWTTETHKEKLVFKECVFSFSLEYQMAINRIVSVNMTPDGATFEIRKMSQDCVRA